MVVCFKEKGQILEYIGGDYVVYHGLDPDLMCYFNLMKLAKETDNYHAIDELYYLVPGKNLKNGLRRVYDSKEVLEMVEYARKEGEVSLYAVHVVEQPVVVAEISQANTGQVHLELAQPNTGQTEEVQFEENQYTSTT